MHNMLFRIVSVLLIAAIWPTASALDQFEEPQIQFSKNPATEGDTITLTCLVAMAPITISFYRGDVLLSNGFSTTYQLKVSRFENQAKYKCSAHTAMSDDMSMPQTLSVYFLNFPKVYVSSNTPLVGDDLVVTCSTGIHGNQTDGYPPPFKYRFKRGASEVLRDYASSYIFTLRNVQMNDSGIYHCDVFNVVLRRESVFTFQVVSVMERNTTVFLSEPALLVSPNPASPGTKVSFSCDVRGTEPLVRWVARRVRNLARTVSRSGSYEQVVLLGDNKMEYFCIVYSSLGQKKSPIIKLLVSEDAADPKKKPQIKFSKNPAMEEDTITLTCQVAGIISETIQFYRGDVLLSSGSSNTYQFKVSRSENQARYKCSVSADGINSVMSIPRALSVYYVSVKNPTRMPEPTPKMLDEVYPAWPGDFKWSLAGPILGYDCLAIKEPYDPNGWNDNYFSWIQKQKNPGLKWSNYGQISGMTCISVLEPADKHGWDDNYLCLPHDSPYNFTWSNIGRISGVSCLQWLEGEDPDSWDNNFLCGTITKAYPRWPAEFKWSVLGPVSGYECLHMHEPDDPHMWHDNYLCWFQNRTSPDLRWSHKGPIDGKQCIQIKEKNDPNGWNDNYLCMPKDSPYNFVWSDQGRVSGGECLKIEEGADPNTWDDNFLCNVGDPLQSTAAKPPGNDRLPLIIGITVGTVLLLILIVIIVVVVWRKRFGKMQRDNTESGSRVEGIAMNSRIPESPPPLDEPTESQYEVIPSRPSVNALSIPPAPVVNVDPNPPRQPPTGYTTLVHLGQEDKYEEPTTAEHEYMPPSEEGTHLLPDQKENQSLNPAAEEDRCYLTMIY